jgi:hypothetical protein
MRAFEKLFSRVCCKVDTAGQDSFYKPAALLSALRMLLPLHCRGTQLECLQT